MNLAHVVSAATLLAFTDANVADITTAAADSVQNSSRPNIVVILADDMGYSDLGCTGGEIRTPNLDRLAEGGVLMTHCYNTSRCCPSRAALLTGQYQWDAGIGHMNTTRSAMPEYQQALRWNTPTLAELLLNAGYQTIMSGKWHVGDQRAHWPDRRGFQQFYGTPKGGGLYFYPSPFYDRPVFRNGQQVTPEPNWYSTDAFTDFAIEFLRMERDRTKPFFMYLAYIAPHYPLQARKEDIGRYTATYRSGYRAVRTHRFERQKSLGVVPKQAVLPSADIPRWVDVLHKDVESRKMAVYAAQVDRLDQNVGRLLKTLQQTKAMDNTIIMFLSDNGGCSANFNKTPQAVIGTRECNAAYGHWYTVSNTPFRKAKAQEHEGGIITPLVVQWPNGIKSPNRLIHTPVHIMDIMPTCLELAQVTYPSKFLGQPTDPADGRSFLPLLNGAPIGNARTLCWEHEGNRAIRQGKWKLVALRKRTWELYNLSQDPTECRDLAATNPQRVERMAQAYAVWATKHGVRPWPLRK